MDIYLLFFSIFFVKMAGRPKGSKNKCSSVYKDVISPRKGKLYVNENDIDRSKNHNETPRRVLPRLKKIK